MAVPIKLQMRMAVGAGIGGDRVEVLEDAGHSPMISCPGKVVGFIRRAAGEAQRLGGSVLLTPRQLRTSRVIAPLPRQFLIEPAIGAFAPITTGTAVGGSDI
ncbi:hypothetical protein PABG_12490 [Paracoccidioides brasiliensis Pb03]|nr:hypothetical protein PABG_12490 [Paracoccidioides brasiliensis Pb03]